MTNSHNNKVPKDEQEERLRYLETWGLAYMYLYALTFAIILIGVTVWAIKV